MIQRIWPAGLAVVLLACCAAAQSTGSVSGRLVDAAGAAIRNGSVVLRLNATGAEFIQTTATDGTFRFGGVGAGEYLLRARAEGFAEDERTIRIASGELKTVDIQLQLAILAQQVVIHAHELAGGDADYRGIPGAVSRIDAATLTQSRAFTCDEALRLVPGVYTRGEEGFGLRPNIGIRGLNPTRSSKVLLLEDGVPVSYAPYGDNASYYHPPVDRFEQIEVVKGSGQILYGPSTVGGVINYLTPAPPEHSSGSVTLIGGNHDYFNGHLRYGGRLRGTGFLMDYMRKQGAGTRDNTRFGLHDATVKALRNLSLRQSLSLKANYYGEDSRLTYSGLRWPEWLENPRANPFRNDTLDFNRYGAAATHMYVFTGSTVLATTAYGQRFQRDWWRQSSNSGQRPNDAADPLCGGMANLNTTCGNEGRLRDYLTWGVEPRLRTGTDIFGFPGQLELGFRAHFEEQDRVQMNGDRPDARTGPVVENNERAVKAYSGFLQNRFSVGKWALTPGLRLEHVRYSRLNRLLDVRGRTQLSQWIPGLGVSYNPSAAFTAYAGVHRGFAPPRVEDVISNSTGGSIDLAPEMSWNYEAGVRARPFRAAALEAAFFRIKFENQIVPASVAGGTGAVLTSAGETSHQGAELSGRLDWRSMLGTRHSTYLRGAYTWLGIAEFAGTRFSNVTGFAGVQVTGNRLPYAPAQLLDSAIGYVHASGFNALIEAVHTGGQFSDDLNTWILQRMANAAGSRPNHLERDVELPDREMAVYCIPDGQEPDG